MNNLAEHLDVIDQSTVVVEQNNGMAARRHTISYAYFLRPLVCVVGTGIGIAMGYLILWLSRSKPVGGPPSTCSLISQLAVNTNQCTLNLLSMCTDEASFTSSEGGCALYGRTQTIWKGTGVTPLQFVHSCNNIIRLIKVRCVPLHFNITNSECCKEPQSYGRKYCSLWPEDPNADGREISISVTLCACTSLVDCSLKKNCSLIDVGNPLITTDGWQCLGNTSYEFAGALAPSPCASGGEHQWD